MADILSTPVPSVPVIDPQTGLMTPVWYDFFNRIAKKLNTL